MLNRVQQRSYGRKSSVYDAVSNLKVWHRTDGSDSYYAPGVEDRPQHSPTGGETAPCTYYKPSRLATTTDRGPITYAYTPSSPLNHLTRPGNRNQTYGYDLADRLKTITDPDGQVTACNLNEGKQMALLSNSQSVAYAYGDYGLTTQTAGDPNLYNPYRFTGQQYDSETGLYYLRARHYNPALGRFISRDPAGGANLFSYCGGDPVNYFDPSGLKDLTYDIQPQHRPNMIPSDQSGAGPVLAAGIGLVGSVPNVLTAAYWWAMRNPVQATTIATGVAEGLSGAPPGALSPASLLASAALPNAEGQVLTVAGRALAKHPNYFGFCNGQALNAVLRTDAQLNEFAAQQVDNILTNGVMTTGAASARYPEGWITYTLPSGVAASWDLQGAFVGFRGPR